MPVREILVGDGIEADGMNGIGDVQQDAVAGAGARREAGFGKHRDVVALVGHARLLRSRPLVATLPQSRNVAGRRVGEDPRAVDDPRPSPALPAESG